MFQSLNKTEEEIVEITASLIEFFNDHVTWSSSNNLNLSQLEHNRAMDKAKDLIHEWKSQQLGEKP